MFWCHHRRITARLLSVFAHADVRPEKRLSNRSWQSAVAIGGIRQAQCAAGIAVLAFILTHSVAATLFCSIGASLVASLSKRRREVARWQAFDKDLPTLLTSVASSVRAGVDPLVALSAAKEFFQKDSEMAVELSRCAKSLAAGADEYETIAAFARSSQSTDVELFRRCLVLSRRHGSALADPLHRITRVVRQRHSFRRKTRAALAMHRLSALGIAVCAALITSLQLITNFDGVRRAAAHPVGFKMLLVGACLIALGVFWMSRMGKEQRL